MFAGDVRLREVLQTLDHAEDHGEEDHRADRRQRHPAQSLEPAGAVELGRLVQMRGHVEHGGEEDHHRVADAPEAEHDERRLRPGRILEPQRPVDAEVAEDRVHRAGRRVEDVDEAERRGDGRRERRQVEDRPEDADAAPCTREHQRDAEREHDLQRHEHRDHPERVPHRRPDLRVGVEQVAVVREPDPARRRQQVVVVQRQVRAHHERVPEEDGEADEPGAHEQEHEAPPPPLRPLPGPPALRRRNRGRRCGYGTPPPPLACFTCASSCLSRSLSPAGRSFDLAGLPLRHEVLDEVRVRRARRHDRRRSRLRVREDLQERREVRVGDELLRMRRRGRRRHVAQPVRELRERVRVRRQVLDEIPRLVGVVAVLRDADDRAVDVAGAVQLGMRIVDRHRRRPVLAGSGCSSWMKATRHSPSRFIATLPFSNAFDGENSSPSPAWNFTRLL